jgi:hypothetical protein
VLTRRDLDQIAERLGASVGPTVLVDALLRQRLAEAHAALDVLAREPAGSAPDVLVLAARRLLAAHGHPGWTGAYDA